MTDEREKAIVLYQSIQAQISELIVATEDDFDRMFSGKKQGVVVSSLLLIAAAIMNDPLHPLPESLDPIVIEMFRMFLEKRHNGVPAFVGFNPRTAPNS